MNHLIKKTGLWLSVVGILAACNTQNTTELKTNGPNIILLLARELIKWVLLSVIIAFPIAWYVMSKWLQGFAYRINLGVDIFILGAVIALAIGLATVTWQSLKTAFANPVEALRYE